jgi:hypothetical protein
MISEEIQIQIRIQGVGTKVDDNGSICNHMIMARTSQTVR